MNVFGLSFTLYVLRLSAGTAFYKYTNQHIVRTQLLWFQFIGLVVWLIIQFQFNFYFKNFEFYNSIEALYNPHIADGGGWWYLQSYLAKSVSKTGKLNERRYFLLSIAQKFYKLLIPVIFISISWIGFESFEFGGDVIPSTIPWFWKANLNGPGVVFLWLVIFLGHKHQIRSVFCNAWRYFGIVHA